MQLERKRRNSWGINIAPLVDMVFLLLLFFLLTWQLAERPAININLPKTKTASIRRDTLGTIYITKDKKIFFMEKEVDLKALGSEIKKVFKNPELNFIRIEADIDADIGILISVIDELRLIGIRKYSILTQRR